MANAYAAADLVISRAGAGSISEFCLLHKPVILVPSPNVAEDHQTKNALALVDKDAAIYVKDVEAKEKLLPVALETIANPEKLQDLSKNIAKLALPDSATIIAKEVLKSLSPCPSPVGRGTEIVLQNTNKSNFKTPLPTGEGSGERPIKKGCTFRYILFYIIG